MGFEEYIDNLNKKHDALIERYAHCHAALAILREILEDYFREGTEIRLSSVNIALEHTDIEPIEASND